jgi:hypothetical protein
MAHATTVDNYQLETSRWSTGRNVLFFAALVSVVACVTYLVAFGFTSAVGLGALFFVQVQYLSGSAWSVVLRRIMENILMTLPVGALLFLPIVFGLKYLYPWTDSTLIQATEVMRGKSSYLNEHSFVIRTYAYFLVWSIWIFNLWYQSTKQDTSRSIKQMHIMSRWSAPGLFLVIAVGTLAAWDWLMSLQPTWYSTIFGLYYLADGGLAFFGVLTLICLGFRRAGILEKSISLEHYHDLGKWLFAMTCFYTYMGFSQFLLIWYANIPEETSFYRHRMGGWLWISLAYPVIRFFIPFFALLSRRAKRNLTVIGVMAAYSIAMVYLDIYWVVMPVFYPAGPQISWMDFAALGTTVSVCALMFWSRFKKHKLAPVGDLRFEQSLHFENA